MARKMSKSAGTAIALAGLMYAQSSVSAETIINSDSQLDTRIESNMNEESSNKIDLIKNSFYKKILTKCDKTDSDNKIMDCYT